LGSSRASASRDIGPTPKEGAADVLWVLLSSREFLFNH
jgi:hypothetical protein